jgi:hypothetical protein
MHSKVGRLILAYAFEVVYDGVLDETEVSPLGEYAEELVVAEFVVAFLV